MLLRLECEALATPGATAIQYLPATLGRHTGAKAVGAGALQYAGLKCSFHSNDPDWVPVVAIVWSVGPPIVVDRKKGGVFYWNATPNSIATPVIIPPDTTGAPRSAKMTAICGGFRFSQKPEVAWVYAIGPHVSQKIYTRYPQVKLYPEYFLLCE